MPQDDPGGPKWIQLLVTILKTSGPVALIAFVLVYYLMASITSNIRSLSEQVKANHDLVVSVKGEISEAKVEMHAFASAHSVTETERARQTQTMLQVLRQMCSNTANSPSERAGCYIEK